MNLFHLENQKCYLVKSTYMSVLTSVSCVYGPQFECCGLVDGYKDWGSSIPPSCNCQYPGKCVSTVRLFLIGQKLRHIHICLDIYVIYVTLLYTFLQHFCCFILLILFYLMFTVTHTFPTRGNKKVLLILIFCLFLIYCYYKVMCKFSGRRVDAIEQYNQAFRLGST